MFACARIPDLDCFVFGAADESQRIGGKRPDAFDVTEEAVDAATTGHVPETDRAVERAGEHVGWWVGTVRVVGEEGGVSVCGGHRGLREGWGGV